MKPASLSSRLGLVMGLLSALLVIALALLAYVALDHELDSRARRELASKYANARTLLRATPDRSALAGNRAHALLDLLAGHNDLSLVLLDESRAQTPLLTSDRQARNAELERLPTDASARERHWQDAAGREWLSLVGTLRLADGTPVRLLLSLERSADNALLAAFGGSALTGVPVLLMLVGMLAWYTVQRGLSPLQRFGKVAARISTEDLSHRISLERLPLELSEVAQALNLMLHRLDTGVQQLTQFSDDLAHELRSPISNLLGKTQVTLARERQADVYRSVLVSSVEELERLARIVQDMLFLAQVNQANVPFECLALHEEARKVTELFEYAAEERQLSIDLHGQAWVFGERLMLQRALSNLLSNAIRHTPVSERIDIEISHDASGVSLSVSNPGPGIAEQHLPRLFERFYRADDSRARQPGGTGLGLAIVRSIMSLHGGTVSVRSQPQGPTRFTLRFPGAQSYALTSGDCN